MVTEMVVDCVSGAQWRWATKLEVRLGQPKRQGGGGQPSLRSGLGNPNVRAAVATVIQKILGLTKSK
ncbi:hypothetical protein RHMOL_Rhmol11G0082200 [Rhododendron molle]|uniref:Uncharacterized protein n=1 Tax=Rhododendron molle TaxID=49168 RepID=A0ACC0LRG2_RHOML|nr:hypothetical protein RHMOL_Rhmol11G0082200 [Rhododendron molle]